MATQQRTHEESGFTVVELVIVMVLLGMVMSVLGSALWSVQRSEAYTRGRTVALDDMRANLKRMTKDLRQTSAINGTPTASRLSVQTYVDGLPATVVFDVTNGALTRNVNSGTTKTLETDLISNEIFTYTPDAISPNMVKIVLVVKPSNLPDTTLTLNSEVELRNR